MPGLVEGRPAILVFDPNEPGLSAEIFMLLQWSAGKVATIRDFRHAPYVIDGANIWSEPICDKENGDDSRIRTSRIRRSFRATSGSASARNCSRSEKELTRQYDRVNAERRRLPMVKLEKNYVFEARAAKLSLKDLFEGRRQLIVYHFMFDPAWEKGCPGCTGYVDAIGDLVDARRARHDLRHRLARAAGQARGLQGAAGLEYSLVFLVRQRLQLRFPRHQ